MRGCAALVPLAALFALGCVRATASDTLPLHVLFKKQSAGSASSVQVVERVIDFGGGTHMAVRFLTSGRSVVGAAFVEPEYRDQSVFGIFAILGSVAFLKPAPRSVLLLGLGAGTAAAQIRTAGIPCDVVEIDEAIVHAAALHFGFQRMASKTLGRTYVADALRFLAEEAPRFPERYDVVIHDMYAGANPVQLMNRNLLALIKNRWLSDSGVLFLNFLGPHNEQQTDREAAVALKFTRAVVRTLNEVFEVVRCFREIPLELRPSEFTNIVCIASQGVWALEPPRSGDYDNPPELSPFWIVKHFQEWEVHVDHWLPEVTPILDFEGGSFQDENLIISRKMWATVRDELLPGSVEQGIWDNEEAHPHIHQGHMEL